MLQSRWLFYQLSWGAVFTEPAHKTYFLGLYEGNSIGCSECLIWLKFLKHLSYEIIKVLFLRCYFSSFFKYKLNCKSSLHGHICKFTRKIYLFYFQESSSVHISFILINVWFPIIWRLTFYHTMAHIWIN